MADASSSKAIMVIHKESEVLCFEAADYDIVSDVFQVLPRLMPVM